MKQNWLLIVRSLEFVLTALLFLAAFGTIAWRNRRNKCLFFGWFGALVVFACIYVVVLVLSLRG
jgi:hypothetical protein